jgi:hypothetical protein
MSDSSLDSASESSWVTWSGLLVLVDPQRDGPELAQKLTEPPFTKVEVRASDTAWDLWDHGPLAQPQNSRRIIESTMRITTLGDDDPGKTSAMEPQHARE